MLDDAVEPILDRIGIGMSSSSISAELVKKLKSWRAKMNMSRSSNQEKIEIEETRVQIGEMGSLKKKCEVDKEENKVEVDKDKAVGDKKDGLTKCPDHPLLVLEYCCQEDQKYCCKECFIFGVHKGHKALTKEDKRSVDELCSFLPLLLNELNNVEEAEKKLVKWMEQFNVFRLKLSNCLDSVFLQEEKKMTSLLSDKSSELRSIIDSLESLQERGAAGIYLVNDQTNLDQDYLEKLVSQSIQIQCTEGSFNLEEKSIVVTPPRFKVVSTEDLVFNNNISDVTPTPVSSPELLEDTTPSLSSSVGLSSNLSMMIPPVALKKLDGSNVTVVRNGVPDKFYCQTSSDTMRVGWGLGKEDFEDVTFKASQDICVGQGILVRRGGALDRAVVLRCKGSNRNCEMVDKGEVVKVELCTMMQLPANHIDVPATTVCCTLEHVEEVVWTEKAKDDWERLVSGKQLELKVLDENNNVVKLMNGCVNILDNLQFLGHLPEVVARDWDTKTFNGRNDEFPGCARLCPDSPQPTPDSLFLQFHTPQVEDQIQLLSGIDRLPNLVSPPGLVQQGSAVLAPWDGHLYRAQVEEVLGTDLSVVYVDYGNTDIVSWWDCCVLPDKLLFAPLATEVRLAGIKHGQDEEWTKEACERLQHILSSCEDQLFVKVINSEGEFICIELKFKVENCIQDISQVLVDEGFAIKVDLVNAPYQSSQPVTVTPKSPRSSVDSSDWESMSGFVVERSLENKYSSNLIQERNDKVITDTSVAEDFCSSINERKMTFSKPSSILIPHLPTQQIFKAIFMHVDSSGVVWVVPESSIDFLSEVIKELEFCSDPVQEVFPGMLVVARTSCGNVRARVVEDLDELRLVDIDSGKMVMSTKEDLLQVSPLLDTPPLAIPLKLYGIKKSTSSLCQNDLAAVIDKVGNNPSSLAWCLVSLICQTSKTFPLPANVRYNMNVENDGNLALDLVELGLFEIITSLAEWEKEISDNGLDWMLDPMTMPSSLSFLPNPVPLAVGQWLVVSVEGLEYIFNGTVEKEPDIETPHVNRIAVQFKALPINSTFNQDYIYWSIKCISHQIQKLENRFSENRASLAMSADSAYKVLYPNVGQSVLVFFEFLGDGEGGEWSRGTVESILEEEKLVKVHYTDYGYRGLVKADLIKSMSFQERRMPVQVRHVQFKLPNNNKELRAIRNDLNDSGLLMRVDQIVPIGNPEELEQIIVNIWKVVDVGDNNTSNLIKVC